MGQRAWIRSFSLLIIISALFGGLILSARSKFFILKDINIQTYGSKLPEFIQNSQMQKLNSILDLWRGRSIWWISTEDIYASVIALPWIEQAEIRKRWPSGITVMVRPKSIVALMPSTKGELVPIGVFGDVLPSVAGSVLPDVPILQGESFRSDQLIRRQATELILALPTEGRLSLNTVQSIFYSSKKGFALNVANVRGPVFLGTGELPQKVFRVNKVIEYLSSQSLESRVIDATYDKKVLVRLRKGP